MSEDEVFVGGLPFAEAMKAMDRFDPAVADFQRGLDLGVAWQKILVTPPDRELTIYGSLKDSQWHKMLAATSHRVVSFSDVLGAEEIQGDGVCWVTYSAVTPTNDPEVDALIDEEEAACGTMPS